MSNRSSTTTKDDSLPNGHGMRGSKLRSWWERRIRGNLKGLNGNKSPELGNTVIGEDMWDALALYRRSTHSDSVMTEPIDANPGLIKGWNTRQSGSPTKQRQTLWPQMQNGTGSLVFPSLASTLGEQERTCVDPGSRTDYSNSEGVGWNHGKAMQRKGRKDKKLYVGMENYPFIGRPEEQEPKMSLRKFLGLIRKILGTRRMRRESRKGHK